MWTSIVPPSPPGQVIGQQLADESVVCDLCFGMDCDARQSEWNGKQAGSRRDMIFLMRICRTEKIRNAMLLRSNGITTLIIKTTRKMTSELYESFHQSSAIENLTCIIARVCQTPDT